MRKLLFVGTIALTLVSCKSQPYDRPEMSSVQTSRDLYEAFQGDVLKSLYCARQTERVIIVAHRGGFAPGFPENSIHSINQTMSQIPAIIEIDVVSSEDGRDFLHHDKTLDRTTTGTGPVNKVRWAEIARLHLRDNSENLTDYKPNLFDDVLSDLQGKALLMVDLKSPVDTASIVEKLSATDMLKSTVLIAYNADQYLEIVGASKDAVVALGANNEEQVQFIEASTGQPIVALTGSIGRDRGLYPRMRRSGHFSLVGTYNGDDPVDNKLDSGKPIDVLGQAATDGVQLVVSNRPIDAYQYLESRGLVVDPSHCR